MRTVSLVTLGCARNEVDSEELAARLTAAGWELTSDGDASVVLVNTCGFIQAAKQESISELLSAAESGAKVAAVGCLAERYGAELADELPEAQVLSFDDYGRDRRPAGRRAGRPQAPRAHRQGPPHPAPHHPRRPPARAPPARRTASPRPLPSPGPQDPPSAGRPTPVEARRSRRRGSDPAGECSGSGCPAAWSRR